MLRKQSQSSASDVPDQSGRCEIPCAHCGLATACDTGTDPESVFCCQGCRQAYDLIRGWGLDDYYALRDRTGGVAGLFASTDESRLQAFDDEEFLGASRPRELADGTLETELSVGGLHCAACAWLIENVASRTPGWQLARVRLNRHTLQIIFDPAQMKLSEIAALVGRLGYVLTPLSDEPVDRFREENRRLLMRIAVAGFCAANAMWIAIALYAGDASGVAQEHRRFLRIAGTALGLAAVAFPGRTFFVSALASLRTRTPHMDLPVALGLSVGTLVGLINAILGRGEVYFDSLAMLVFLLLIGRWIQFRQQHRAASAVDLLLRITPQHARLVEEGCEPRWVMVDTLSEGQSVRVNVGESVPVDGTVIDGETMLDRSLLTGESVPVEAVAGESVTAGTVNLTRPITVAVEATGENSRIGKVMQSVESAMDRKTPIVQLADRIGGVFVVAVTVLAALAFVYWFPVGVDQATNNATSLLIVACPCALALATPLAIAVTLGRAAKRKILIRDGDVFQQLSRRGRVWFDKTGTLTEGRPRAEVIYGKPDSLRLAAAVESEFNHPIAAAMLREAERLGVMPVGSADGAQLGPGGVSGCFDGQVIHIGNEHFLQKQGIELEGSARESWSQCLSRETTPICIAVEGQVRAVVSIADPLRTDAASAVERLQRSGWELGILSGDHPAVVHKVSRELGIDPRNAFGGLSPEDKLSVVTQRATDSGGQVAPLDRKTRPSRSGDVGDKLIEAGEQRPIPNAEKRGGGPVVMIGDGANDAAALAAADVGVAVRGGAEVSLQAAPVFIASGNLNAVSDLVAASRRCDRLIRTTFAVSLAYNVFAVILAFSGHISPLLAALLMPLSSVSVLSTTLVWPTFRESVD